VPPDRKATDENFLLVGKKIEWDYRSLRATNAAREAAPFIKRLVYRKGWENILKA